MFSQPRLHNLAVQFLIMPRIIFSLLLFVFFSGSALGQEQRKTYLGIKGGYNLSSAYFFHSFDGVPTIDEGWNNGFHGGIIAMNYWRNHIGLQAELNYTRKGWTQRFNNGEPDYMTKMDYIELPLLVNLHTGKKRTHLYANLGCFVEYMVKFQETAHPVDPGASDFFPYIEERDNKFGYGFRGGVGAFRDFGFGTFLLEGHFSYSLSSMLDPVTLDTGVPNISNHYVIGVSVAYMISFGEL